MTFDNQLFLLINRLTEFDWIRSVAPVITWLGDVKLAGLILFAVFSIAVATGRNWQRFVGAALITFVAVGLVGAVLKPLVARSRPYEVRKIYNYYGRFVWQESDLRYQSRPAHCRRSRFDECVLRDRGDHRPIDYSFPSGHALIIFGTAGLLWSRRKWRYPILIIAILVGISRIILGYHYPSDVLVGGIIGFIVGYLTDRHIVRRA